jgi:hypothetical protein
MGRQPKHPDADWTSCPAGRIVHLGQQLRQRRQRRKFLQTAVALTGTAAMGAGVWLGWTMLGREPNPGGLTCSEVQRLAADYRRGKLGQQIRDQVQQHLARCPQCESKYRSMGLST